MKTHIQTLRILLADDDEDDRFFFRKALIELSIPSQFKAVHDGEQLMKYLAQNAAHLPNVLFLDLNMPRKNGSECLSEIKSDKKYKDIPVIIYSTSLNEEIADVLYNKGAHYYIRKHNFPELKKMLQHFLYLLTEKKIEAP